MPLSRAMVIIEEAVAGQHKSWLQYDIDFPIILIPIHDCPCSCCELWTDHCSRRSPSNLLSPNSPSRLIVNGTCYYIYANYMLLNDRFERSVSRNSFLQYFYTLSWNIYLMREKLKLIDLKHGINVGQAQVD